MPGAAVVVDAETARPVAGVVVAAKWTRRSVANTDAGTDGATVLADAVTDEQGRFTLPSMSWIHSHAEPLGTHDEVGYAEPLLYLLKGGYRYTIVAERQVRSSGHKGFNLNALPSATPWWDGHVFRLERPTELPEDALTRLTSGVPALDHCRWVEAPRFAAAYVQEIERVDRAGSSSATVAQLLQESCPGAEHKLADYVH
jgi:hypothetical protein